MPTPPDPIQLELYRNLFEAAAEEMGITLQRCAFSANIKERRDFSCAIFDPQANLLAQAAHIPVHLGSMPASVHAVLQHLGPLNEGDVAIVNDPYAGGTHLPDITLVSPVYSPTGCGTLAPLSSTPSTLLGYVANRAHHADVGGLTPGSMTLSRHIDEEGYRIPPTLLCIEGTRDDSLLNAFLRAVRTPDERLGDLDAQLAANTVGATALHRIAAASGVENLFTYASALQHYAQTFSRRLLNSLPAGQTSFQDPLDGDGFSPCPIPLKVTLHARPDELIIDFRDNPDQVAGPVNCPRAVTVSAAYYCLACLLGPDVPLNAGAFRDLQILTRPGSILDARYPAAVVAGNTETSQRVVDLLFGALAGLLPDRIPAASCGTMSSLALGSSDWTYYETIGGGCGASPAGPGASAIQCHMTNTLNTPAEALELQYPLRVLRFERAPHTGGAGQYPGGDGIIRELQALAPAQGTLLTDRRTTRPYGLSGGAPASPGHNSLNGQHLAGKCQFSLQIGDILRITTPGGGGWGAPTSPNQHHPIENPTT